MIDDRQHSVWTIAAEQEEEKNMNKRVTKYTIIYLIYFMAHVSDLWVILFIDNCDVNLDISVSVRWLIKNSFSSSYFHKQDEYELKR